MRYVNFIGSIIGITMFISCSNSSKHETAVAEESVQRYDISTEAEPLPHISDDAGNIKPNFIASSAASDINDDENHKFIRTAQMKFKVNAIPEATYKIEDIAIKNKGFIIRSSINNEHSYSTTTDISKDSAIVTYYYNLVADMKLKVPKEKLDTVLKEMAPLAVEINYRTIDANDVTLQILSDKLKKDRLNKKQKRVSEAIDNKGKKLDDIMDAENILDNTLLEADKTTLATYSLNEQIAYSTIDIKMYQSQTKYTERILREKPVDRYQPGFGTKAIEALAVGWSIVCELIILILYIWPLLLIGGSVLALIYYIRRKKNSNK